MKKMVKVISTRITTVAIKNKRLEKTNCEVMKVTYISHMWDTHRRKEDKSFEQLVAILD